MEASNSSAVIAAIVAVHMSSGLKECIIETVHDNPNTEDDLLFDIMKCNFRHTSTQYNGEKRCKDKKLIELLKGKLHNYKSIKNNPPDEIVPQITKLTSKLNC